MRLTSFAAGIAAISTLCGAGFVSAAPNSNDSKNAKTPQVWLASAAPQNSLRPSVRPAQIKVSKTAEDDDISNLGFRDWLAEYRPRAMAAGISAATLDLSLSGIHYNTNVIQRDRNQSEFSKTIWEYLDSAASDVRISNGRAALAKHDAVLSRIEAHYGVEKEVVTAVWGLESAYGTFRGSTPIIEALATLAFDGRRGAFFETQLTAALQIIQSGDVRPEGMTGSWAGAMGHTQFIPTSYLSLAVDFDGDGKRDIWSDDPTDALASTAAYLESNGWTKGQPWGVEVQLPDGFDYALAKRDILKTPSLWAQMGVVDMSGKAVPNHGQASVLLPAGAQGVALMIFDNFRVIETYNTADAYVIGVGLLSDRIGGAGPLQGDWPREDRALTYAERIELQERLTTAGFDTQKIDGKIGPLTIEAVRQYQRSIGAAPDGYASLQILKKLR